MGWWRGGWSQRVGPTSAGDSDSAGGVAGPLYPPPHLCVELGGGSSSSCRVGSGVTGYPLPQLFSLQLDSDPGLPHTEAIHSSFSLLGPGWPPARPAPAAPAAF